LPRDAKIVPMDTYDDERARMAAEQIAESFVSIGARGYVHARPVQSEPSSLEVALDADRAVCAASVIKILFAVAFARAVCAGALDPTERVEVPDALRIGGSGTAGFADPPLVSLRDLALSMMTVSDNAATDIIFARVGRDAIEAVVSDLGLTGTRVVRDMLSGARQVALELGFPDTRDLDARLAETDPAAVRALDWLDPARSNAMTPRDATTLLDAIWNDQAAPPQACATVRRMMAQQQNTQRLASGFGHGIAVAGKTGTLPTVRNEAGVVTYPDGQAYAISIFTRTESLHDRDAPLDAAIGSAAAIAVGALRHRC
jgi:beta-lactamase class A